MAKPKTIAILTLALLLSLLSTISFFHPSAATIEEVKWSKVNIPANGETGNWVLASGSNVRHLTMAADGTLYCYANPSATNYTLFKSTDGGYNWSNTGRVTDTIVAIAAALGDASTIFYATTSDVYKSADAGNSFTQLPPNPGGAGSNNIEITDISVTRLDDKSIIAVSTRDSDSTEYGGVYILDENKSSVSWIDTSIGSYDACAVAFSPNFATDQQLVAMATDETDTLITTRIEDTEWDKVFGNAIITGLVPISAAIAFPDDFDATTPDYTLFVAIDSGSGAGDIYTVSVV